MADFSRRQVYEQLRAQLDIDRASTWDPHWRELGDFFAPERAQFYEVMANNGQKRSQNIVNNTGLLAVRAFRSGLMSGFTSPSRPWFAMQTPDPDLMEFAPVKAWLADVAQAERTLFARSGLYRALPTTYTDLGVFGTSAMIVEPDPERGLRFHPLTIGSYWLASSESGRVDTLVRRFPMTARQMAQRFGQQALSQAARNLLTGGRPGEGWIWVVQAIRPNEEYDGRKLEAKYKKFASCYYEEGAISGTISDVGTGGIDASKMLGESGYDRFPALCPRWDVKGNDVYGWSPGMDALGDNKALQMLERRKAQAIEKQVNPPLQVPIGNERRPVRSVPGGLTVVDKLGENPIRPLYQVQFELQYLLDDLRKHEERIDEAFYKNLFLMMESMDNRQPITAAEVQERHEEKLLQLGPALERQESELLEPVVDMGFDALMRSGRMPPPPAELQGVPLKVEFISILAQAQRAVGMAGVSSLVGFVGQIAQLNPEALDKVDFDQAVDEMGTMTGAPPRIIRSDDQVAALRKQRAQQAQVAQQQQTMMAGAKTARDLAAADTSGDNGLTRILNSIGAPAPAGA